MFVDQWGKRCILEDKVWELKLDQFGRANHCQDRTQIRQREYLLYDFKAYDNGKTTRDYLHAALIPNYNTNFAQLWDLTQVYEIQDTTHYCQSGANWVTNIHGAYCRDLTSPP